MKIWLKLNYSSLKHYLVLTGIIIIGGILRFWHLDFKPLGIDEVLTAIFSLGKTYEDVPKEIAFALSDLQNLFTLRSPTSCLEIAGTINTQSTHPPLFFCLMHQWLNLTNTLPETLVWNLRALPALLGVGAIALVYLLNRIAFSTTAGLMGAVVMAVSPFGIYLSQEARHYTFPLFLITIALLGLVQIQKDLEEGKQRLIVWLCWSLINSISFYVHYFCVIGFIGQVLTLILISYQSKVNNWLFNFIFCLLPLILLLPWFPILQAHFTNPKTSWLPAPENIIPILQILITWVSMVIALPVENQSILIQILMGLLMIGFASWLSSKSWFGLKQLWQIPQTQRITFTLCYFIFIVLGEFLTIVYILNKDITVAPRYNFIYFPAICALLGASLGKQKNKWSFKIIFFVGLVSCIFVGFDLVYKKPYLPELAAERLNQFPDPLMIVVGYQDTNEVALGLSYALALDRVRVSKQETFFAFLDRANGYGRVWQKLAQFPISPPNLWIIAPKLKQKDYPHHLDLANKNICTLDSEQYYRIGIPYQLYRCQQN